jgi:hypothetical protein
VRCRFEQQDTAKLCCLPDFQGDSVHYPPRYCDTLIPGATYGTAGVMPPAGSVRKVLVS